MGEIIMNKKTLILLVTSFVGTLTWADNVTVPNTFVDGTTASASEVNANFDAIKSAVDDNDSRITTNTSDISTNTANITVNTTAISAAVPQVALKDTNGVYVGRVIGMENFSRPYVFTDQGYRTVIRMPLGMVGLQGAASMTYESTDCTGTAYVSNEYVGTVFIPQVNPDTAYNAGIILYVPHNAQPISVLVYSALEASDPNNLICVTFIGPGTADDSYPAYLNDPNITGIHNTAYPVNMLIE